MMNRMMKYAAAAVLAASLATSCFKDVSYETDYILNPLVEQSSGDLPRPLGEIRAYAFAADTSRWEVASFDDAMSGVITSRLNPSERRSDPFVAAEPYAPGEGIEGLEGRYVMHLDRRSQLVVVADPTNRLYAYTQYKTTFNLPRTYVSLTFQPYREGNRYKQGDWIFRNDFYTPPVYLDCRLAPLRQSEENGPEEPFEVSSTKLKAYAFAADTTLWRVASYEDALNGVLTLKSDPGQTRDNPNAQAYADGDAYRMRVSEELLMLVVVDRSSSMYAYVQQRVDLTGEEPLFTVTFRPWQEHYLTVEEGWRIVDDRFRPEEPEEPGTQTPNDTPKNATR